LNNFQERVQDKGKGVWVKAIDLLGTITCEIVLKRLEIDGLLFP